MAKVLTITKTKSAPVFNMEVDKHHNYMTPGGIVFHNCDGVRYYAVSRTLKAEAQAVEGEEDDDVEPIEDYHDFMRGGEATAGYLSY